MDTIYSLEKSSPCHITQAAKQTWTFSPSPRLYSKAQRHHLRKPHYSHLLTERAACDALRIGGGGGWGVGSLVVIQTKVVKMRLALKCKLLIVCRLRAENPQSVFHAKHMIPFHKDNPDMPKYVGGFFIEIRSGCFGSLRRLGLPNAKWLENLKGIH